MLNIGCHLSSSKGYMNMLKETEYVGGNTFQFFTRNPRGGQAKPIDLKDVQEFCKLSKEKGFAQILAHAPYTLNPCAEKENVMEFTKMTMADDLERLELTPGNLYNFHPGSHVGQGIEVGIEKIAGMLNAILKPDMHTTVLLETMAGKGSEVGSKFEEIRAIIDKVELSDKLGVCFDTCHVHDAGYDIVNDLDGVLAEFDRVIGLDRLKAIHLNDSKNPFESHKDRHEKIGEGFLQEETFRKVINHEKLRHLPFLLETPNEIDGYKNEISFLKGLYNA